jgi:hypothetical protein
MENSRFVKGDLGTHFIDQESGLLNAMKQHVERRDTLAALLPAVSDDKKKIAAISAAVVAGMRGNG